MPRINLTDEQFAVEFQRLGPTGLAKALGVAVRNIFARRREVEGRLGVELVPGEPGDSAYKMGAARLNVALPDGQVLVGSDAHYWPGKPTTAHRAFVKFVKKLKPALVVINGDVFDGSQISRHPPIGWEKTPLVVEEIEAAQERMDEIERAARYGARLIWPLGNHDARYETRLATVASEYKRVEGMHLKDHFPEWEPCYSLFLNDNCVIKHRFKGGVHATHNNTLYAGLSMVTGHLHSLKVTPFTDYRGTRYGVDTGTLSEPFGPQFEYQEDAPRNQRSGFVLLTFRAGRLLMPEPIQVFGDGEVEFRGDVHSV